MWTIYSKQWGPLKAAGVRSSETINGAITVTGVVRDGKPVWAKIYLMQHDVTSIIPPKEL